MDARLVEVDSVVDGTEKHGAVIVRGASRWVGVGLTFVVGVATGVLASGLAGSDRPEVAVTHARVVGCGAHVTLVVDAEHLPDGVYELHGSLRESDRVLPLINSMTYPLIGGHRDHQSLVPHEDRLLVVANVPLGKGQPLRYELVGNDSEVLLRGTIQPNTCG